MNDLRGDVAYHLLGYMDGLTQSEKMKLGSKLNQLHYERGYERGEEDREELDRDFSSLAAL